MRIGGGGQAWRLNGVATGIAGQPSTKSLNGMQGALGEQQPAITALSCRREAVPLVDAFDIPDGQLNSALGRFDGDVYKHLFDWALKAPRNKEKVRVRAGRTVYCCGPLLETVNTIMGL